MCRFDSAYYGYPSVSAALACGADVTVTVPMNKAVKTVIAKSPADAWTKIKYTNAVYDEDTQTWVSAAEVAEIPFTAFSSRKKAERVPGRLIVRRIPELNPKAAVGSPRSLTPIVSIPSSPQWTPRCWTRSPPTRSVASTPG